MFVKKIVAFFFISLLIAPVAYAQSPLKAAFIREDQLWIKVDNAEIQLTSDKYVTDPKWSFDGRFIAYLEADQTESKSFLTIYDTQQKVSYQPYEEIEATDFKWAPNKNQLAYLTNNLLNVTQMENDQPQGFDNVSLGVYDFEWYPDGESFIVSSTPYLLPTGWAPIQLFKVPITATLESEKITHLYSIPATSEDFFAIAAQTFKWSADGKWLSFIASPTASLSNDSTTLCVISETGQTFQQITKMLGNPNWIKWAPSQSQLAYISGEGRFWIENKETNVTDLPSWNKQKNYTPKGFVDIGIDWLSPNELIVSRAKENNEWTEGPVPPLFSSLYVINIDTTEERQLTFPEANEMDIDPQVIDSKITWFRQKVNEIQGDVWIKDDTHGKDIRWLKDIDEPAVFYH